MTKKLRTSDEGRRCGYPGCERLLSIYNHESYCRVHLAQTTAQEKVKPYRHVGK